MVRLRYSRQLFTGGIEIACRPSVLSVTLMDQDHIGWKSWKLIARRSLSLTLSVPDLNLTIFPSILCLVSGRRSEPEIKGWQLVIVHILTKLRLDWSFMGAIGYNAKCVNR